MAPPMKRKKSNAIVDSESARSDNESLPVTPAKKRRRTGKTTSKTTAQTTAQATPKSPLASRAERLRIALRENPPHVFVLPPKSGGIWKNQQHMAGYLNLKDTTALLALIKNSEVVSIIGAYAKEKAKAFGQPEFAAESLPGGKQSNETKTPGLSIPVRTLCKTLANEDVVTAADIAKGPTLPLDPDHDRWGVKPDTVKVARETRKWATVVVLLVELIRTLECIQPNKDGGESPSLLGAASSEDFYRAYQFFLFYESYKEQSAKKTVSHR